MQERSSHTQENFAAELFARKDFFVMVNSRLLCVRFVEEEKTFKATYYEVGVSVNFKELGGSCGPSENDTYLSLNPDVKNAIGRKLRDDNNKGYSVK